MTFHNVALVSAVVAGLFGLAALLVPAQFLALFGVELSEVGLTVARLFGVHVLMIAIIDWFARNDLRAAGRSGAEQGIVVVNVLSPALSIVLIVAAFLAGNVNELALANVAILAVIGAAWLYVALVKSATAVAAT